MQTKFKDGTVMVCGGCARDAELQIVGEKSNRLCKVGLAVGKRPDPEGGEKPATVWCNVVAWHGLASSCPPPVRETPSWSLVIWSPGITRERPTPTW